MALLRSVVQIGGVRPSNGPSPGTASHRLERGRSRRSARHAGTEATDEGDVEDLSVGRRRRARPRWKRGTPDVGSGGPPVTGSCEVRLSTPRGPAPPRCSPRRPWHQPNSAPSRLASRSAPERVRNVVPDRPVEPQTGDHQDVHDQLPSAVGEASLPCGRRTIRCHRTVNMIPDDQASVLAASVKADVSPTGRALRSLELLQT
jgi:hypothetical protein